MKELKVKSNKAVLYCRVSTKEQVQEGNSLVTQEKACREFAVKNGYDIAEIFIEQGESAKTQNRTELKRLLGYCANKKNEISAVIAYKIDRISRNTDDYSQIRIVLKKYGVEIKSTSEYFENTPAGRFMENIIANVAQFDNDVRAERCTGGMKEAMREGRYVWMAPVGYRNTRIAGKSTIDPDEKAPLIRNVFSLILNRIEPLESIRLKLVKKGLLTRYNKPVTTSQFHKLIRNPVYKGSINKFGEFHKGSYEPLVSEEEFDMVQRILKNGGKTRLFYKMENPDFPLRRFVIHEKTNGKLTGNWSKGGQGVKYPYYRFIKAKLNFKRDMVEDEFKSFINQYRLNEQSLKNLKGAIERSITKETKDNQKDANILKQKIDALLKKQNTLFEDRTNGYISGEVLKRQMEIIEAQLKEAQDALAIIKDEDIDYIDLFENVQEFLIDPYKVWENASVHDKQNLQKFEFPQGIYFDGKKFRTDEICRIFKLKNDILNPFSYKADLKKLRSNSLLGNKDKIIIKQALVEANKVIIALNTPDNTRSP